MSLIYNKGLPCPPPQPISSIPQEKNSQPESGHLGRHGVGQVVSFVELSEVILIRCLLPIFVFSASSAFLTAVDICCRCSRQSGRGWRAKAGRSQGIFCLTGATPVQPTGMNFKPSDLVHLAAHPQMRRGCKPRRKSERSRTLFLVYHSGKSICDAQVQKKKCSLLISSVYDQTSLLSSSLLSYPETMSHHVPFGYLNLFWFNCPFLFGLALLGARWPSEIHFSPPSQGGS